MSKIGVEFDKEAQKDLDYELGTRELYPYPGMWVAETLKEHGVKMVFGVQGGHIWNFTDAISRIGIKNITFRHEQNAVYCGEAYAQVSGKTAVCYATVGPGVGNSVSAIQQANLSNSPILMICGGHEIEHDKLYNTIQESYATELMGPISKWAQRVPYPHTIKQFFTRAFKEAQAPPKGPVVMEVGLSCLLTDDVVKNHVWGGAWGDHASWIPDWHGEETVKALASGGNPDDIAKAVKRLYETDKPFMVLGDGAAWADASEELTELVNLAKIPFTTRRIARAVVSEKHDYYYRGLPGFRKEIELMVNVGAKIGFFDGFGGGWPETIQISDSSHQVWTYLNTSTALLGSPKVIARQMIDYIKANNLQPPAGREAWLEKIKSGREEADKKRNEKAMYYGTEHPRYQKNNFMHYGYLSKAIQDYLDEKYESKVRIMIDGYTLSDYIMSFLKAVRPAQILSSSEQAGVGHGLGMAMGAAFAQLEMGDKTPVLALMGDAGMSNAGMEIDTAVHYRLPIVFLVTENKGWLTGMKSHIYGNKWQALGEQDRDGVEWMGIEQKYGGTGAEREFRIRYDRIAQELGCYGESVDRHEDFTAALDRCFKAAEKGQPAVLNCVMDTNMANVAITAPIYTLCYAHIPWKDLAERGRAARRTYWAGKFTGLQDLPEMAVADTWEPVPDEE
jgi:thiamine pyrophosphate-dependent acetolactate synthase large subunit-like protein